MLKIKYISGSIDGTLPLDPSKLTGDLSTDRASDYIRGLRAGRLVTIDTNGYVTLAEDGALFYAVLVNDAFGGEFENVPALASGHVAALIHGCVIETDEVVEDSIVPGDKLYIGTGTNAGMLTKTAPATDSKPVAVARTANSTTDKTVEVVVI